MLRRNLKIESLESRDLLTTLFVVSDADSGAGTFRDAIETANLDPTVDRIAFRPTVDTVELASSVEYTGGQDLKIAGRGVEITSTAAAAGTFDLFVSSGDANLNIRDLGLSNGAKGFFAPISAGATGEKMFVFKRVTIEDNGLFGLHIDDQTNGSDASLKVKIFDTQVRGNGVGALDFDGVRVDEGGIGGIYARVIRTTIDENGGDGLELDERGEGGVRMLTRGSTYNGNGFFDVADLDDGLDIDEADNGDLWFRAVNSTFSENFDEGLDLDEEQGGNVYINLFKVEANDNKDEGIKVDEKFDDANTNSDGNLVARLRHVTATGNADEEGIALTEEGAGNFFANLSFITANDNGKEGIDLAEEGDGNLRAFLLRVEANDNGDDGIQLEEAGAGRFAAVANAIRANGNAKFGVKVEQETVSAGDLGRMLLLVNDLSGNTDGDLDATDVTVF